MINSDYIKELHERDYSIYDSTREMNAALKELKMRSYMILDEDDNELLFEEYSSEFVRLAHRLSFVTNSPNGSYNALFDSERKQIEKKKSPVQKEIWTDKDVTPTSIKKQEEQVTTQQNNDKQSASRLFYLKGNDDGVGTTEAEGLYDPVSGNFVLKKGSILPLNIPPLHRYTATDIQRRMFVRKNCNTTNNGYVLRKDYLCRTPEDSIILVLGYKDDWLKLWKDKKGFTVGQIYNT